MLLDQVVSNESGDLEFHVFSAEQVSIESKASVAYWKENGHEPTHVKTVEQVMLSTIIEVQPDVTDWHLLCINVEGVKHNVLQGLNWEAHRPWVVVLEAVWPGSPRPNHQKGSHTYLAKAMYLSILTQSIAIMWRKSIKRYSCIFSYRQTCGITSHSIMR